MKQYSIIIIIALLFSACLSKGDDTIILPEKGDTYLPEEIASTWKIAIKCKTSSDVAVEATLTTLSDSKNFTATGTGKDYDGDIINLKVTGTYEKEFNILTAEFRYDFVESGTYRIDYLALDIGKYNAGSYVDLIKIEQQYTGGPEPSCETEIKLFY